MAQVNLGHVVGPGVPTGGTAGQVLKKNGSTNFDASWATLNSGNIPISASDNTTVQQSLAAVKSDMGIVEDGNTATHTIAAGQYVIWKGALYTASAAIPSGTTLSTSNLTAVSDGGLNSLNGKIAISSSTVNINSYTGNVNASVNRVFKSNGIIHLSLVVSTTNDFKFPSSTTLFTIPDGYRPNSEINVPAILQVGETRMQYFVTINTSGQIRQNLSSNTTSVLIDTTFVQ